MKVRLSLFQMEKYSKHLEVLVAERTQDLMHEKQRTDRLLYSTTHIYVPVHLCSLFTDVMFQSNSEVQYLSIISPS